jgi:Ca2+-binding RTX toxin-like protein
VCSSDLTYDTSGSVIDVQVIGNYAYVTDGDSGLQIIDISNPTTPILKDAYDTSGFAYGLQVVGNYAYVADREGGLKIIDVSDFTGNLTGNQAPTNLSLSNSNITENQPINTVIGDLTSTDPDAGDTFTYSLVTGTGDTDNALFTIAGNQLQTNAIFDYETQNGYSVRIRTTDQGNLTFEKQLTIGVTDLNEITGDPLMNNGRNPIVGTAGPDYLTGGAGAKTLTGGGGNDSFVFTNMRDVGQRIADFTVGQDKLVFTQLFSSLGYTGSNPIADSYIKFVQGTGSNSAHTFLQIDRDGLTGSAIARNFLQVDNITPTLLNNSNNFQF